MGKKSNNEDSDFCLRDQYKMRRSVIKKNENIKSYEKRQKNSGKWNIQEKTLYVEFLQRYSDQIVDEHYRKEMKIFKQISLFVRTRTPDQCRSHHQKILKIHKSVENILRVYEQRGLIKPLIPQIKDEGGTQVIIYKNNEKRTALIETKQYFRYKIQGKKLLIQLCTGNMVIF